MHASNKDVLKKMEIKMYASALKVTVQTSGTHNEESGLGEFDTHKT